MSKTEHVKQNKIYNILKSVFICQFYGSMRKLLIFGRRRTENKILLYFLKIIFIL